MKIEDKILERIKGLERMHDCTGKAYTFACKISLAQSSFKLAEGYKELYENIKQLIKDEEADRGI